MLKSQLNHENDKGFWIRHQADLFKVIIF